MSVTTTQPPKVTIFTFSLLLFPPPPPYSVTYRSEVSPEKKINRMYIHRKIYFKELAYIVWVLPSPKSVGKACRLETQRSDAVVWRQNSSFLRVLIWTDCMDPYALWRVTYCTQSNV
jgi:hypothetical protein